MQSPWLHDAKCINIKCTTLDQTKTTGKNEKVQTNLYYARLHEYVVFMNKVAKMIPAIHTDPFFLSKPKV